MPGVVTARFMLITTSIPDVVNETVLEDGSEFNELSF